MSTLLIQNAKLIDGHLTDIFISGGKIKKIVKSDLFSQERGQSPIPIESDTRVLNMDGKCYVSAGWIDMHTHCYPEWDLYYDDADEIGYKTGVTTVVDAGSCGSLQIQRFCEINRDKVTNVLAFLNIADKGICVQDELSDLSGIVFEHMEQAVKEYPEMIVGLKARMSASVVGEHGIVPLVLAIEAHKKLNMPLMVHCGSAPPLIEEILNRMGDNTILTHCFHGKPNGILLPSGECKPELTEALGRGMALDVGHGRESFDAAVAGQAKALGLFADVISTDIYEANRISGPVFSLASVMSKFLAAGYSVKRVIESVTGRPAELLGLHGKGRLEEQCDADITIFDINERNEFVLRGVVACGNYYEL